MKRLELNPEQVILGDVRAGPGEEVHQFIPSYFISNKIQTLTFLSASGIWYIKHSSSDIIF